MDAAKRARLEAAGYRFGDAEDFLGLTPEEVKMVDLRLALGDYVRELRCHNHWTQTQVAERIGSSQSRVAKMEASDGSVSIDLMIKALFWMGASSSDVGRVIAGSV
jgi:predicted XRE-type DNA-binding protein